MFVLSALDSGGYSLFGDAIVTDDRACLFRFDAYFEVTSLALLFVATGEVTQATLLGNRQFHFEITPCGETLVSFVYRGPGLSEITGTGIWVKDCYLLSGRCRHSETTVTACIVPKENQIVEVKAAVHTPAGKHAALHFTLGPHEPQQAMANVISIQRARRA